MSDHVFENMLQRLSNIFGEPKTNDTETKEQYLEEYAKQLEEFTEKELRAATEDLISQHHYKSWPTVAECISAARRARQKLNATGDGNLPSAGVKRTGWCLDKNGKKWFRIQKGSPEYVAWMGFYKRNGYGSMANAIEQKDDKSFVIGPDPKTYGQMQINYLRQNPPPSRASQ